VTQKDQEKRLAFALALVLSALLTVLSGTGVHILNSMYDALQRIEINLAAQGERDLAQDKRLDQNDTKWIAHERKPHGGGS